MWRDLAKAKEAAGVERWHLICPTCHWEVTVYGDPWLDLLGVDWEAAKYDAETDTLTYDKDTDLSEYDPDLIKLFWHEHSYEQFVEKRSGRPFFSKEMSGMGLYDSTEGAQPPPADDEPSA